MAGPGAGNADSLECAICLEQLREPSTLPCNHTFCRECILRLPGVREAVGSGQSAQTTCPLCRGGVSVPREVPVNPIIRDMLEQLAQAGRAAAAQASTTIIEIPAGEVVRGAEIGRGAMGIVFAGTWCGRPVALKVIEAAALGAAEEREAAMRRLRREAAILSMMRHPCVVQFYGLVWEAGGGATLVTEKAEKSLRTLLAERRLSLAECIDLGEQLLWALAHLHSRNIVHRDVKPGNILVFRGEGMQPQYKLADFGIALAGAAATATTAVGTVAYAAPEALRGEGRPDFAGDVYGAAVVLNEALAGRVPFAGVHPFQLMQRVVGGQRPELATEGVPAAVQALVQQMWAGEAAVRPTAEEARRALSAAHARISPLSSRSIPSVQGLSLEPAAVPAHAQPPAPAQAALSLAAVQLQPADTELHVAGGANIMDAVRRASPGQTIRLAPGRYNERVVLDKEVHIVGPREAVLEWDSDSATLTCSGPTAPSVRGITIRNSSRSAGRSDAAVWIASGSRAVLECCDVSCSTCDGVVVIGEGTAPMLRSNIVHDCGNSGIRFLDSAKGVAEGNDICGNKLKGTGITITSGADPVVRDNKVHENGTGIRFQNPSTKGIAEENDIFANKGTGIAITFDADPVVRGNKIHDNRDGIYVVIGGKGTIVGNTFERNLGQSIEVNCTGCRVEGNTIL